jgi:hypothetical protein
MDKATLIEKIKKGNPTKDQILNWVSNLPGSIASRKPIRNKIGDVYMHPVFMHPYILLEKKNGHWLCGLLTTESKCPEILEMTKSRFYPNQYITKTLFTATEIVGSWANSYDNPKHLREVRAKLKAIFA